MYLLPSAYWWIVLIIAFILLCSTKIVYMKILSVARDQIKSIELLVLQVCILRSKAQKYCKNIDVCSKQILAT